MARAYILFFKPINPDTATSCLHACRGMMGERDANGMVLWDDLLVTMSSGGGDIIPALGMYNEMKGLEAKVQTHNAGAIDSAAILPFMAGSVRTASAASAFFFHQLQWTFAAGSVTMTTVSDAVAWLNRYEGIMADVVAANSTLKRAEVLRMMKQGTSVDSETALKKGLIHRIEELATPLGARTYQA